MKKVISIILTIAMLMVFFSACSYSGTEQTEPPATEENSLPEDNADKVVPTTDLTCDDIVAALNQSFAGSSFGSIKDITEVSDAEGGTVYMFTFYAGLAMCTIREVDGKVHYVTTLVSLSDLYNMLSSLSAEDQLSYGLMSCALPIHLIHFPNEDTNYLPLLLLNDATTEGSVTNGTYVDRNWKYSLYCSDVLMSISATNMDMEEADDSSNSGNASNDDNTAATQPPATQPPATQPPATQPPATQPPATQPPATQPPATQPPATQPPATQPVVSCAHNYTDATCTTPQTCTLCGQTKGSAWGHTWIDATCTEPAVCSICQEKWGSAKGHVWRNATCTAPKTCQICKATEGSALPHNYVNATCTTPEICTLCGKTNAAAFGHSYSAATCTTPKTCDTCGTTSGSALGHKWSDITQTVYHEEQGHFKDVQKSKTVKKIDCFACSVKTDTLEEYYTHFDTIHGDSYHYLLVRELYEIVEVQVYETVTVWIVDQKAYTEVIVIGHKCDVCGETR